LASDANDSSEERTTIKKTAILMAGAAMTLVAPAHAREEKAYVGIDAGVLLEDQVDVDLATAPGRPMLPLLTPTPASMPISCSAMISARSGLKLRAATSALAMTADGG
jgi:hypothetical protein